MEVTCIYDKRGLDLDGWHTFAKRRKKELQKKRFENKFAETSRNLHNEWTERELELGRSKDKINKIKENAQSYENHIKNIEHGIKIIIEKSDEEPPAEMIEDLKKSGQELSKVLTHWKNEIEERIKINQEVLQVIQSGNTSLHEATQRQLREDVHRTMKKLEWEERQLRNIKVLMSIVDKFKGSNTLAVQAQHFLQDLREGTGVETLQSAISGIRQLQDESVNTILQTLQEMEQIRDKLVENVSSYISDVKQLFEEYALDAE